MLSLDVSKDQLVCALLDPRTTAVLWEQTVPNTPQGVDRLLTRTPAEHPWVMEPTGRYSLQVAKQATQAGRQVFQAPPKKAKEYLRSLQSRAKTDRLDARGLGRYCAASDAFSLSDQE